MLFDSKYMSIKKMEKTIFIFVTDILINNNNLHDYFTMLFLFINI